VKYYVQGTAGLYVDVSGSNYPVHGADQQYIEIPDPVPEGELLQWTPIIGGQNGESGQAYSSQRGDWLKTSTHVNCWAYLQFSAVGTINGELWLKNLPMKSAYVPNNFAGTFAYWTNLRTPNNWTDLKFWVPGGANYGRIFGAQGGNNPIPLTGIDVNDHSQFILYVCYPIVPAPPA